MTIQSFLVGNDDLPAIFRAADHASLTAQQRYLQLVKADLLLLVVAVILGGVALAGGPGSRALAVSSAIVLALSLFITASIRIVRYERVWYGGRAIAESVKTLAWKYMTGAEPYTSGLPAKQADDHLLSAISDLLAQRKHLAWSLGGAIATNPQITSTMQAVRNLDMEARKSIYVEQRLKNQRDWYSRKAGENQRLESNWFVAIILTQAFALIFAIVFVAWPNLPVNLAGVFSAISIALLAWLQVKKHQELAQSYGLAAHELGLIIEKARHVTTEEELTIFVSDAENAMSREHTMWTARRDAL